MLAKPHRFHGLGSLKFVYGQGKTVRDSNLSLRFAINPRRRCYRLAVVVSKKNLKSAVARNRIRRRIYEQIRQYNDKIIEPYDIVVTVFNPKVAQMPANMLAKAIRDLLTKANIV